MVDGIIQQAIKIGMLKYWDTIDYPEDFMTEDCCKCIEQELTEKIKKQMPFLGEGVMSILIGDSKE